MIVYNTEYGGLYNKDEQTGQITRVLRLFIENNKVVFRKFDYANNNEFEIATSELLERYQCSYYLEDGSRPLKHKNCDECHNNCYHNQKYYE